MCWGMFECIRVYCSVLKCIAVCCSVWQCVAVCGSVLQVKCITSIKINRFTPCRSVLQCMLQCVAVCYSVLQCVLQCVAVCVYEIFVCCHTMSHIYMSHITHIHVHTKRI